MRHEPALQTMAPIAAPTVAVRRSAFVPLLAGMLGTLVLAGGAWIAVALASGAALPLGTAAIVAALVGLLAATGLSYWIAGAIAELAARPLDMLLEQLDPADLPGFGWAEGRTLRPAQIDSDLKLLRRRIREITRRSRLMIEELKLAREQANRQNVAKSQFLANMSHELRTPLNAILGYAMLLHEDATSAGDQTAMMDLDRIQQAGRNLLELINDILDLAKIEAGRATAERVPVDVRELVGQIVNTSARTPPNDNRFELSLSDEVGFMMGDPGKIRQCLTNLLGNAFKFTHGGVVSLQVSPIERDGEPAVEFAVCDTGIGIGPEQLENLFDAFQQGDAGATRHFGGTGLGLAIVSRLARLMGGECEVQSQKGQGSVFRLVLPLGNLPAKVAAKPAAPAETMARLIQTPSAERTALVIDDDEAAIDLMQRWLVRRGYNVVCTTGGDDALELARAHGPDLIMLDVLMPGRSGYEVLEELQADRVVGKIPTILITVDDDRERGLRAGAVDYLRKPVTEQQLREVLDVYALRSSGEILVIDDDDDAADLLTRSVAQVGFSTRRASDGLQGIAMAREARPDAIVLDLAMPIMDGFEVLEELALIDGLREVPLIVVSGIDISIEEHRMLVAAGHRFFPKAVSTPREIAQSLKELVA